MWLEGQRARAVSPAIIYLYAYFYPRSTGGTRDPMGHSTRPFTAPEEGQTHPHYKL